MTWKWDEDEQYKMEKLIREKGGLKNLEPGTRLAVTLKKHFSTADEKETGTIPTVQSQIHEATNLSAKEVMRRRFLKNAKEK